MVPGDISEPTAATTIGGMAKGSWGGVGIRAQLHGWSSTLDSSSPCPLACSVHDLLQQAQYVSRGIVYSTGSSSCWCQTR